MVFRDANENDFERVHELMYQIFKKHLLRRPDIYQDGDPYTLKQYASTLNNENEMIILAEKDNVVVGLCHMSKKDHRNNPTLKNKYTVFIEDFCVDKDYYRQGIGRALYNEAIRRAKMWNASSLELNVWEVNKEARKFYDAVGLKVKSTHMETKL